MVQFCLGLAPVDGLVDVLGGSSVGPRLVFDWFLIGVVSVVGVVGVVALTVELAVVPGGRGGGGGGMVEGVVDVDGGGG